MESPFESTNTNNDTVISFQLPYLQMDTTESTQHAPIQQLDMQQQIQPNSFATGNNQVNNPEPPVLQTLSKQPFTFGQPTSGTQERTFSGMKLGGMGASNTAPATFGCMAMPHTGPVTFGGMSGTSGTNGMGGMGGMGGTNGMCGKKPEQGCQPGFQSFTSTSCIPTFKPTLGCNLGQPPKVQYYTFNPQTGYKPVDIPVGISQQPDKKVVINSLYDELKKIRNQIESLTKSTDEIYHIIRYLNDN
jgi:hypothetical protein